MADILDSLNRTITDTNLTLGELKSLILGLKTGNKETKGTSSDYSELRKILESSFKDFKDEIAKLNKTMEKANKLEEKQTKPPSSGGSTSAAGEENENKKKKKDEGKGFYAAVRAKRALSDLGSMTNDLFVGVENAYGKLFKGIVTDERKFIVTQKEIAYETQGALIQNTKLLSTYTDLEKTVSRTGVSREDFQKNYTNAIKAGNRDLKIAKALTTAQLNTERQLGIEAGGLADTFDKLNTQFGMSEMQIAEMGRGMREVAKSSGLTGSSLKKAVESSTQFMEMMRNAGQLTSLAAKNIQAISASAQKFGIEKELSPLVQALSSSSNLIMESSEQTKNLLFLAANQVGRVSDVLNGTILKTKQGTKDIAQGLRKVLADFGVQSLEAIENLTDQEKFRINLTLKSAFGIEVDQAKRQILALEEGSKNYAERLADLNKEMKKNLTMEEKAIIREKERSIKLSASLGLLTALDEASKNAKNMGEAFSNFNAKANNYADELNALGLTAKSEKEIAKGAFISAITNINKSLESTGKKPLNISSTEIEKAINNPEAMRQLSAKLSSAEQEAATAAKAQLDPAKRMDQTLMELNERFKGFSNKVLTYLGASAIGNIIANAATGINVAITAIGKALYLYEDIKNSWDSLKNLGSILKEKFIKGRTPTTGGSGGLPAAPPPPPNSAEIQTAEAVEMGTRKGSFYTHDTHAEKVLNNILESLRSSNQMLHKIASECCTAGVGAATGKGSKTIAEQKAIGQMKYAQFEGDPAAKALQKSKDRHERKMIKEEKLMNKKKMKNIKDETLVNKSQKSSVLNQGGFEIMGFDLSALQGQGLQMAKAAPALMILGVGAMLLGTALIWVCNKILSALGIDLSTVLETSAVVAAVIGATGALMAAVTETKELFSKDKFEDFQKTAWELTKNLVKSSPALFALGITMVALGAGLIWVANKILSVMEIDNQKITETAETIALLLGGLAIITGAVGAASYGLKKLNEYMPLNELGKFAKEIALGALTVTLLTIPLLTLSAILMKFCSGILSILGIDQQTINQTVETVNSLLFGLATIATGVALSVLALMGIGAGVAALFFDPSGTSLLIAVTLLTLGTIALGVLLPVMIGAASVLMNFCSGILSGFAIDTEKINSTVELVSTLIKGLASIATNVGIAALGLMALGAGAAGLIFGGPMAVGVFLGLITLGTAALALLTPAMLTAASVVMYVCNQMIQMLGVNETDIKRTIEATNTLFDGLKDLISGFATSAAYLIGFASPTTLAVIGIGFFIALPLFTGFLKSVTPFITDFSSSIIKLVNTVSQNVGGIGNVDYVRRFAEDMNRAIAAIVDMLKVIGTSLYQLAGKSWLGLGSSVMDDILYYSKGFTEAMEIICRDVIKRGVIDPINTNFNKIGIRKTKQALYTAQLIGKTMVVIGNMIDTLADMVGKFSQKASWWRPLGNTVIEELKETGEAFSKHFKEIIKVVNEGIITPIAENFRNIKSVTVAANASRGLAVVFTSLAQFMTVLKEKIKPLTDEKSTGIPFWYTNEITEIQNSMARLKEPLLKVFESAKDMVSVINVGQSDAKRMAQVIPALNMFSKIAEFMNSFTTNLQPLADKTTPTLLQRFVKIPFFSTVQSDMDILTDKMSNLGNSFSKVIDSLTPIIDKMYISGQTMDKKNDKLEVGLKRLTQFADFTSKMAKVVEDYNKSAEISKNIKAQDGGFTMASKNISIAIDETQKFVDIVINKLGGKGQFDKIKSATNLIGTLGNFTKALSFLIDGLNEAMGEIFSLQQEMYNIGSKATGTTGGGKQIVTGESKNQWGTLNVDELSKFLQEITGFAINFASSIFKTIDSQNLPDTKGMNEGIKKITSLIKAVHLIGTMMSVLQEVFNAQEDLNKTLGGGKVDGKDKGNQIRQIKTHMGDKMDSVIELGASVIQKIQQANIGDLKGAKEALQKFTTCISAVQAVGFLMRVLAGDGNNSGLIDVTNTLNEEMKKMQEKQGKKADKNAIEGIKQTLGDFIDPVIDLSQFIIQQIGDKLKDAGPEQVKKLVTIAQMLNVFKYITVALRDMLMSKTENIVVGGVEKKASVLEALSEGKDTYISYFEKLGELLQGVVKAVDEKFIDPSQIDTVRTKVIATWEVTENLAFLLSEINKNMSKIFKDYMTYGINTYNGFRSGNPSPMQDMGEGTNLYFVQKIIENFANDTDWNKAIELVGFTVTGLNRMMYDLEKINTSVDQINKNFKSNWKIFEELESQNYINWIGTFIRNHFYARLITAFPQASEWDKSIGTIENTEKSLDTINDLMVRTETTIQEIMLASKEISSFSSNNAIEKAAESIKSNVIDPINEFMPSETAVIHAVNTVDMVTKGIIMISNSLTLMSESLESIGNLNLGASLDKMFSAFSGLSGLAFNPISPIASMFGGSINAETEIRREKATTETNVKSNSSVEQLATINQKQLDAQLEMVEILEEIRDSLSSGSELSGESGGGDVDTSSRKIQKKPINLYKWGAGQFHRGTGVGLTNTGIKGI